MHVLCRLWLFLVLFPPIYAVGSAKRFPLSDQEKEWLYMVDPIITYEERREFRKNLTSHRERAAFIDLFWAKRDPDLSDDRNPFKETYLARYDYVKTHFEKKGAYEPANQKSIIYLLLGQPDKMQKRLDHTLVGGGFRNGFPQWPPEVWIYNEVGFDYKRPRLRVQFLPTSVFGDYGSRTDAYTTNFIRTLKNKFIVHPDLEQAPVSSVSSTNFQDVVDLGSPADEVDLVSAEEEPEEDRGFFNRLRRKPKERDQDPPDLPAKPMEVTVSKPLTPLAEPKADAPARTSEKSVPDTASDSTQATSADKSGNSAAKSTAPPTTRELSVPGAAVPAGALPSDLVFDTNAGNALGVAGKLGYFSSGRDQQLMLGRLGFPLRVLDFTYQGSQYHAPFTLHYRLLNSAGQAVLADVIRSRITLPSKSVLAKKDPYYTKEFAVILPPDRYKLQVQLEDSSRQSRAYQETLLELPRVDTAVFRVSDLCLMDANVNPDAAKFRIEGVAYGLHLSHKFSRGERLYPLIELIDPPDQSVWERVGFQLVRNGLVVREMSLYQEEATLTGHGSLMIHPVIKTDQILPGTYVLRFELEDDAGELFISEVSLEISNP